MSRGPNPTVQLGSCTIRGLSKPASETLPKSVDVFLNIPYARAERFEHPVPSVLPATLDATKPGSGCPVPGEVGSEDCLRLNVTRPSSAAADRGSLPVLVYVHGGAFNFGDAGDRDMESVVSWSEGDVVAVSVGYRLGVLGFAPFEGRVCNLGLRDQAEAFRWVRRWIGRFGGDAGRVTAVGVSAGAHSIGHHLLNPSPPPFRKAILESGSPTARFVLSPSHPRSLVQQAFLLQQALCSSVEELRAMPLRPLLSAAGRIWATFEPSVQWPFQPVVDGEGGVIPDCPVRLWEQRVRDGRAAGMRVLTGFCSHEGSSFVPASASTNDDFRKFFTSLIPSLSRDDLALLEALYPDPVAHPNSPYRHSAGGGAQFGRLAAAYGDFAYIAPVFHTAHTLSSVGARVYVYEYAALSSPLHAAAHASHSVAATREVALLKRFPGLMDMAREMHGRMTRFVTEPEGDLGDSWPAFVSPEVGGEGRILVFGEGNDELAGGRHKGVAVGERVMTKEEMERMKFWWDRMELVQGMGQRSPATK